VSAKPELELNALLQHREPSLIQPSSGDLDDPAVHAQRDRGWLGGYRQKLRLTDAAALHP